LSAGQQVLVLLAVNQGVFDAVAEEQIPEAQARLWHALPQLESLVQRIEAGEQLHQEDEQQLQQTATAAVAPLASAGEAPPQTAAEGGKGTAAAETI